MECENPSLVGPRTVVYDSEDGYALYVLGEPVDNPFPDLRFHSRVDDCWWLRNFYGHPVEDEFGNYCQVARFEIGAECRYRLNFANSEHP